MDIKQLYQTIHNKAPKVGERLSLATAVAAITSYSTVMGVPLLFLGASKMVTGSKVADDKIIKIANGWINNNNALIDTILPERDWRIEMPDNLDKSKQYLLISNHLSWVDTSVLQYISADRMPLTRFFTKHSLIYIPFVGQAFYFLDFPMIKRHSKSEVAKNPELRKENIEEAKRACQLLKDKPFALLNYLEGTRFTQKKHDEQHSPYTHLLKPKAGGISLAIQALGQQIDGILDMTIVYPDGSPSYDDLWRGNVKRLGVHIRRLDIPEALFKAIDEDNYHDNDDMKKIMYAWLDEVWQYKDKQIAKMLADFNQPS